MSATGLTRRRFLGIAGLLSPAAAWADARLVELDWLRVKHVRMRDRGPSHRIVHFSDLHHKGDKRLLRRVVGAINALQPELVCFTGDLVEEGRFLAETLDLLSGIEAPMYGVPGNHDYWSKIDFAPLRRCFAARGGAWLVNEAKLNEAGNVNLIGVAQLSHREPFPSSSASAKNVLLMHYPAWVKELGGHRFDLILAGHSHGGQVRIPFYGALVVPFDVGEYEMGLYQTAAGPLYVNPGIGYIYDYHYRFNCRPEITLIEF